MTDYVTEASHELRTLIQERSSQDRLFIEEALEFAIQAHDGVIRRSGEPYVTHPIAVAQFLASWGMDAESVAAGLLHDTVEDVPEISFDMLTERFGEGVSRIVEGVTKVSKVTKQGGRQAELTEQGRDLQAENLRQMLVAMTDDLRVIVVKLADRLHNMRTLGSMKPHKQVAIARETIEIFAPLAYRLGMGQVKRELEDLSFRYLDPQAYEYLSHRLGYHKEKSDRLIQETTVQLQKSLQEDTELLQWITDIKIEGRSKHLWSIHQKMQKEGKKLEQIFDLWAVRVILEPISEIKTSPNREKHICYHALSVVHAMWNPLPGRFKDYIALPKPNGYQSLHTTVLTHTGEPIEVQIRSQQMHQLAEYGVASHWIYKQGNQLATKERENWIAQLKELQEIKDASDYIDAVKSDILSHRVRVFTPKGLVISLSRGSTSLDFAYAIHTRIGETAIGAKVNGQFVPLAHRLENGDRIEILTSKNAKPSKDWLQFAVTRSARSRIRYYFRVKEREESLKHGQELLEKALRKRRLPVRQLMRTRLLEEVSSALIGSQNPDDLYMALHSGKITAAKVARSLAPQAQPEEKPTPQQPVTTPSSAGVFLEGMSLPTKISQCCQPVRGDAIIGYLTRGRGVSVHRLACPNMRRLFIEEPERCIGATWEQRPSLSDIQIEVVFMDKERILSDILHQLASQKLTATGMHVDKDEQQRVHLHMTVGVNSVTQLQLLLRFLSQIEGVEEVHSQKIN